MDPYLANARTFRRIKCKPGLHRQVANNLTVDTRALSAATALFEYLVDGRELLRLVSVVTGPIGSCTRLTCRGVHVSLAEKLIEMRKYHDGRKKTIEAALAMILIVLDSDVVTWPWQWLGTC